MKVIEKNYSMYSFEKLKLVGKKHGENMIPWIKEFTKDSLIIIDEVHNMISEIYDLDKSKELLETGILKGAIKGFNTVLLKMIVKYCDPSCKFLFLTATPIFNSIRQLRELIMIMNDTGTFDSKMSIDEMINMIRGRVSYFPGTSKNAYPEVEYDQIKLPITRTQDGLMYILQEQEGGIMTEDGILEEQFLVRQRQVSLACLPRFADVKSKTIQVLANLPEYAPKIKHLIDLINNPRNAGKHVVFSNFIGTGLHVVARALEAAGWKKFMDLNGEDDKYKYKTFAVWDGSTKDDQKQKIKNVLNNVSNMDGKSIRVILGSPSIKEGVSFKHIQHTHILDPVWNQSAKDQVEGRSIRYCSHVDIPEDHPTLKRKVVVHLYLVTKSATSQVQETCDDFIYKLIERKKTLVKAAESALRKVSIDHFLFRKMYSNKEFASPPEPNSAASHIGITAEKNIMLGVKKQSKKKTNTCPKARRPNDAGDCKAGYENKKNAHGESCCYKIKKEKAEPASRIRRTKKPGNDKKDEDKPKLRPAPRRIVRTKKPGNDKKDEDKPKLRPAPRRKSPKA